jgi:hypothetical protein
MKIIFEPLFAVEIYHFYYTSTFSEDFVVVPTAACRRLLQNYALIFRSNAKGFAVFYEAFEDDSRNLHPIRPIAEDVRFSFRLQSKNPYLINFSDLPLDLAKRTIYYLHNRHDNPQNNELLLSADTVAAFVSQQDALKLAPLVFQYHLESSNPTAQLKILDEWSNSVITETKTVVEGVVDYPVDLRGLGPGKYTLTIDGVQKEQFYAAEELSGQNVFGLIDILRHDSVPAAYQFTNPAQNHDVAAKTYAVKINTRKTFWRYYVALKNRTKYPTPADWPNDWPDDWTIAYPSQQGVSIDPQPGALRTLVDGTVAVPFVADAALPLQQAPIKGIQLKKSQGSEHSSSLRFADNLPNPSIASIVPDISSNKIYSEIFIYV